MKKTLLALSVVAATSAYAEHHKKVELSDIDKCYMNAVEKYPGHVLSMESEVEKDRLIYEFDIMTKDGKEVEVECDAKNHTLHDFEVEYKKDDKAFTNAAKISESEAEKIALKKYNGKIVDREYSMENGNPAYDFFERTKYAKNLLWQWKKSAQVKSYNSKILSKHVKVR